MMELHLITFINVPQEQYKPLMDNNKSCKGYLLPVLLKPDFSSMKTFTIINPAYIHMYQDHLLAVMQLRL